MDSHHYQPTQPQGNGAAPAYYTPPAEKTAPMDTNQYAGNYGGYQDPQYQTQPANTYGAAGSHYQATGPAAAPINSGYGDTRNGYGGNAPAVTPGNVIGVKRTVFFSALVSAVVLVALIIGLGAGLGVSQNKLHGAQIDLSNAQASLSSALAAATEHGTTSASAVITPTATTKTSATASSSTVLPTSNIDCPKNNNTVFTASNGNRFQQLCGIDYSGDGADDLSSTQAISMDACMDACANKLSCQGAGWGYLSSDKSLNHTCYMKTNLTQSHAADSSWAFGLLLTS